MNFKRRKSFVVFSLVLLLAIFLHYSGVSKPLENFLLFIVKPISASLYNLSSNTNQTYQNSQDLEDPFALIESLQREKASLMVQKSEYQEVIDENRRLKELLSFINENTFTLLPAAVIAQDNLDQDSQDLVINKGSNDGLSEGLAVVNEEGVLVGKIIEVKEVIAKMCLSINPGCQFAASIQNSDYTQGLVDGNLGLTVKMNYIPQLEKIDEGDIVISSGLGGKIPRGLVIGEIKEVNKENNEVWQEAIIEPPLAFNNLTIVSVVMP